ncbi:5-oxoprolinase [Prunus yedoensis var. nudiflora]|uniref:5-oxoprolinase n=1 Tax=Prunus yedoensis var. nudiflora TaxID=2094558 RepID=A0A314UF98_PRUYE|nr:5-oxoprolinase [Prunus yedoensis var. nudiflora]
MGSDNDNKLRFCIDRGGTFTDVYAEIPGQADGQVLKLLSVDPSTMTMLQLKEFGGFLKSLLGRKFPVLQKYRLKDRMDKDGYNCGNKCTFGEKRGKDCSLCDSWFPGFAPDW